MFKIYYDNEQFVILVDGMQNSSGIIELDSEKSYVLTLLPIYNKTLFLPISSTIRLKNSSLVCNIPYIKLDKNQFYLTPKFAPYIPPSVPHVDVQREFGEHIITVYTDNIPKLLIENKTNFITIVLPEYPEKLQEAVLDSGVLFYCLCKHYLCVVFYDYNDYSVLIDKECDNYEFDENGVTITINLHDNQGRKYISHLTFKDNEYFCDNDYFEYKTPHTPHEKLLGYDFMQAILAEDFEYCKKLLIPNLFDESEIKQMFDGLDDLIIPNCPIKNNYVFALINGKIVSIKFITNHGFIEKIIM